MDLVERQRAWSYARQLIGEPAGGIGRALRSVVAVYATHPTAPLALALRTRSFSAGMYRRVDRDRSGLRVPAMRRTVFLVPATNAARIFAAVRPSQAHALRGIKRHGLSVTDYERFAGRILAAAQEPLSTRELESAVGLKGQELGTVLRALRYEGRVVTLAGKSLNQSPHRYVATSAWAGGLEYEDEDGALAWLAREYLRAYGPARVEDFAWWTGATTTTARNAIQAHATIDVGDGLVLPTKDEAAFGSVNKLRNEVALLPKWDSYTMGHAPDGRRRFVHPDVQRAVYTPIGPGLAGDGNPVILVDGEVVGTWTLSLKEGASIQPFDRLPPRIRARVDEKLDTYAGLLTS